MFDRQLLHTKVGIVEDEWNISQKPSFNLFCCFMVPVDSNSNPLHLPLSCHVPLKKQQKLLIYKVLDCEEESLHSLALKFVTMWPSEYKLAVSLMIFEANSE